MQEKIDLSLLRDLIDPLTEGRLIYHDGPLNAVLRLNGDKASALCQMASGLSHPVAESTGLAIIHAAASIGTLISIAEAAVGVLGSVEAIGKLPGQAVDDQTRFDMLASFDGAIRRLHTLVKANVRLDLPNRSEAKKVEVQFKSNGALLPQEALVIYTDLTEPMVPSQLVINDGIRDWRLEMWTISPNGKILETFEAGTHRHIKDGVLEVGTQIKLSARYLGADPAGKQFVATLRGFAPIDPTERSVLTAPLTDEGDSPAVE